MKGLSMPDATAPAVPAAESPNATGAHDRERERRRLTKNILFNWAGYFLFVISGFILPRLMDARLGQLSLGIWDFGWTIVAMCAFATAGVRSAVSTYVARFVTTEDWRGFNAIVNSCLALFTLAGALTLAVIVVMTVFLDSIFADAFGDELTVARWTLLILGVSAALEMPMGALNGVLTGSQRYGLVNAIEGGVHIVRVIALIILLFVGVPLYWLATAMLVGELVIGLLKYRAARRVAPHLRISLEHVRLSTIRFALSFGGKDLLEYSSRLLMYQVTNVLVTMFLGAPALAIFCRPMALTQHATRFLTKMGAVFEPAASVAYAGKDVAALQELLVKGIRYSLFLSLPLVVGMVVFGGAFLELWMGPAYRNAALIAVLGLGNLGFMSQRATYHVLLGTGNHGRAAVAMFVGASLAAAGAYCGLALFEVDLVTLAIITSIPFTLVNVLYLPWHACRICEMKLAQLLWSTVPGPVFATAPFALVLGLTRMVAGSQINLQVLLGGALSGALLAVCYWRAALPASIKDRVWGLLLAVFRRRALVAKQEPESQ
jgi:O-antigen/teichoic acid export membrane protein